MFVGIAAASASELLYSENKSGLNVHNLIYHKGASVFVSDESKKTYFIQEDPTFAGFQGFLAASNESYTDTFNSFLFKALSPKVLWIGNCGPGRTNYKLSNEGDGLNIE